MLDDLNNTTEQTTQDQTPSPSQEEKKDDKEVNLRSLRERAEAAEQRLKAMEEETRQRQETERSKEALNVPSDDYDIDDDMYLEGRHFKKAFQPIQQKLSRAEEQYKQTQAQLKELQYQRVLADAEQRVQKEYPDYTTVVTQDNLKKLELTKPHLFNAIKDTQDIYSKAAAAYELIKNGNILDTNPEQEERIMQNQDKPRSAAGMGGQSASNSPLSRVGDYDRRVMTPERKAQLQRLMAQYKQS